MIVVTSIESHGGAQPIRAPILHSRNGDNCVFYTVSASSFLLGITIAHCRVLLQRHSQHIDCRQYEEWSEGRWDRRLIWSYDLEKIRARRPNRVKTEFRVTTHNNPA